MDVDVQQKFNSYPKEVATVMDTLRTLIFQVAQQDGITDLTETLKWGEPSYVCKTGSTIRMDWKPKHSTQYCVYFNCKTNLVATFKELYGNNQDNNQDTHVKDNNQDTHVNTIS